MELKTFEFEDNLNLADRIDKEITNFIKNKSNEYSYIQIVSNQMIVFKDKLIVQISCENKWHDSD